jgi:hypothetical protein
VIENSQNRRFDASLTKKMEAFEVELSRDVWDFDYFIKARLENVTNEAIKKAVEVTRIVFAEYVDQSKVATAAFREGQSDLMPGVPDDIE